MEKRAYAVDLLRGLAIVGMVLSGQILWHAELPAWLFHAQVPPPSFRFDPSVPGITWVDLVFPFFLFSMGAAFPLALRKRLEQRGESVALILTVVVRRWALLALFAVALANLRSGVTGTLPGWGSSLLQLASWGCFCALFMRIDRFSDRQNRMVCLSGVAGIAALLAAARWGWGLPVSAERSDVIILVLANMALFGSLVWLYTRNNLLARLGVLALLAALRLGSGVEGSWNEALWNWSPVPWLFRFDYLKYLCIIIPGTIAGDRIYEWMTHGGEDAPGASRRREVWTLVLLVTLICLNMWGLFARQLVVNLVAGVLLCLLLRRLLRGDGSATGRLHRSLFGWGFFWLGLGLALEAFEGGHQEGLRDVQLFFRHLRAGFVCPDRRRNRDEAAECAFFGAGQMRAESDGGLHGGRIPHHAPADAAASVALFAGLCRAMPVDGRGAGRAGHGRGYGRYGLFYEPQAFLENLNLNFK